jgi:hypothetical protein
MESERTSRGDCRRRQDQGSRHELIGAKTKGYLETLASDDIHRLVRVTAFRLLVY